MSDNPKKMIDQLAKMDQTLDQIMQAQVDYCQQRFIDQSKD